MKPEEFEKATTNILSNLSDQAKVSEELTKLNESYKNAYTTNQSFEQKTSDYNKEIQALKETNMNLFLKLNQEPEQKEENTGEPKPEPKTYDNLLKEMGVNPDGR